MRIYYKKKFWAGVGALLLGLALPGTCLFVGWERFDLKDAVLTTFMVLSGISGILRSLDREKARQDRDEDRDERTRYNTYRSRALTFRVLFCLNFVILAGCFIGWWRSGEQEVYIQTAVPCMVLFIVGWITRIASDFYYENEMRIYNKRNFAAGILSLALAVACGVVLAVTGFQTKWLIALVLLLAAGGFDLWWSLSRESRLPRVDERDQAVSRKSAWLAYRIVANGCWIVSLAALVVYGISRIPAALAVTITLDAVTIGAFAALQGAEVYYEKRM